MLILGDVLATLMIIVGICASSWATLAGISALFPQQVEASAELAQSKPWKSFFIGLLIWSVLGTIAIVMLNLAPIVRLGSLFIVGYLITISCVGISGICRVMASRLMAQDSSLSRFSAQNRSAMILVLASIFPVFGWFLLIPILACVGFGAGLLAIRERRSIRPTVSVPPPVTSIQ